MNGAPVSSNTTASLGAILGASGKNAIGQRMTDTRFDSGAKTGGNGNRFKGTIDEVAFYRTALDLFSAQTHYVVGSGDRLGLADGVTLGAAINFDAGIDTDGNTTWEDSIGSRNKTAAVGFFDANVTGIERVAVSSPALPSVADAYHFDGTDKATMTTFEQMAGDPSKGSASFELVFRPDSLTGNQPIFEIGGNGNGTAMWLEDSMLNYGSKNGASASIITAQYDLSELFDSPTDFMQVVAMTDVANDEISLYVNGEFRSLATGTIDDWVGGDTGAFGGVAGTTASPMTTGDFFSGDIAVFRFYPDVLTADQVLANFNALRVPEPSTAVLVLLGLVGVVLGMRRRRGRP